LAFDEDNPMTLWITLFSFLLPPALSPTVQGGAISEESPMRYRGIEQLLQKFEAEAEDPR
jgi:hypothetical protein